ncbi:hypothetical protein CHS0354_039545 [Potamilus streckersoni]|uniref:Amino acid transporter transmembrane domain-containing protein n=1 Tax=Potamilus streckersoni TaxID=2493646 RepID=A0AAE0TKW7_9BIVA|nr:hypothetical protein CHS0354_039545 [Potamilus streckersoni]
MEHQPTRPQIKWYIHLADFANILKAFIGSNYLSVAFAFLQSGLGLGFVGIVFIASMTAHCCHLIVKTKHHAIRKYLQAQQNNVNKRHRYSSTAYGHCRNRSEHFSPIDDSRADVSITRSDAHDRSEMISYQIADDEVDTLLKMMKHMTYGDIGKLAFGQTGLVIVNILICLTQFCFCVAYFIFIGNTIHTMFPSQVCVVISDNTTQQCGPVKSLVHDAVTDTFRFNAGTGQYYIHEQVKTNLTNTKNLLETRNFLDDISSTAVLPLDTRSSSKDQQNLATITNLPENSTFISLDKLISSAPDLKLVVIFPLPVFIFFAYVRTVRRLAIVSMLANFSIMIGCVSVFLFLAVGFKASTTYKWINWNGFPVFFGMVTSAFEGIGLIIPIEASMDNNRHNFHFFLYGAIVCLSLILSTFGCLGYMRFGDNVKQMLNTNIPSDSAVFFAVNICICFGILLTFPLQMFPVIELTELYLFAEGRICGPMRKAFLKQNVAGEDSQDSESLIPRGSPGKSDIVFQHVPDSVPAWKRNILRTFIVLCAAGLAVVFRDSFAYIGAFTGAIGSSMLAYILPCLFHLKICWRDIDLPIKIKDISIVIIGLFASVVSLYTVILSLVQNTNI